MEELDFPVVKETVMSQEEFNEELRAGIPKYDDVEAVKSVRKKELALCQLIMGQGTNRKTKAGKFMVYPSWSF